MGLDIYFYKKGNGSRYNESIGYLRKANVVYAFAENETAYGIDGKEVTFMTYEELLMLEDACKYVLQEGKDLAAEGRFEELKELGSTHLPTKDGFFFGSTEYNEWYIQNVEWVLEEIRKIKSNIQRGEKIRIVFCW